MAGEGAEILATVRKIMGESEHLLTTPEEFTYTAYEEERMIREHAAHENKLLITALVDGKIVGFLNFAAAPRKRASHQGEFGVSILEAHHGNRIGRAMIQSLIDWATVHPKVETLRLRVQSQNIGAIALYQKLGFVEEGREVRAIKLGPDRYDDILLMARHLSGSKP